MTPSNSLALQRAARRATPSRLLTPILPLIALPFLSANLHAQVLVKQVIQKSPGGREEVVKTLGTLPAPGAQVGEIIKETPWKIVEGPSDPAMTEQYAGGVYYRETVLSEETAGLLISSTKEPFEEIDKSLAEVRTLALQGPPNNRIDLTIVGDGYTLAEKEKFFQDVERIRRDLFQESTFQTYLPLFNVHAVFVPSRQSGLSDTQKIDTALGLYRAPQGSKRAILVGNASAAEQAIAMAPDTDYPILLANDDFYGGLGGRYAITTRSVESGKIVLRHELGHNFGEVGEEYDGGQVYAGANHSRRPFDGTAGWGRWADQKTMHRCEYLAGDYVWKPLDSGSYKSKFNFPQPSDAGPYSLTIQLSTVGWEAPDAVEVTLDGQPLPYEGVYTRDRSFFKVVMDRTVVPGPHLLEVAQRRPGVGRVLAFANVYAMPATYDAQPDRIQAFLTFDERGRERGYRPTHESCLMRNMRLAKFCAVDIENMWLKFLKKVKLLDAVQISSDAVIVQHPKLQGLTLSWLRKNRKNGLYEPIPGLTQAQVPRSELAGGDYRVQASFSTPEIRKLEQITHALDFRL